MLVAELSRTLDGLAPRALAESWDNVGLQVGRDDWPVAHILVALEAGPAVVEEAIRQPGGALVVHHPLIFKTLSRVTSRSRVEELALRLLESRTALFALHTNLDGAPGGLCEIAAAALELQEVRPLQRPAAGWKKLVGFIPEENLEAVSRAVVAAGAGDIGDYSGCAFGASGQGSFLPREGADPYLGRVGQPELAAEVRWETVVPERQLPAVLDAYLAAHPYEEPAFDLYPLDNVLTAGGQGRVGELTVPLSLEQLAARVARAVDLPHVSFAGIAETPVRRVAVVTGSGAGLIEAALGRADVLITGDLKYHDAERALDQGLSLINIPHEAFERWAMRRWAERLTAAIPDPGVEVRFSETSTSPWRMARAESQESEPSAKERQAGAETPPRPRRRDSARVLPIALFEKDDVHEEQPVEPPAKPPVEPPKPKAKEDFHDLWTDGGSRGNPGPGAIGVVLQDGVGQTVAEVSRAIGSVTNNVAEYRALTQGLELALEHEVSRLRVWMDSELIVKQLRGEYRVKNEQLKELYQEARGLMGRFDRIEVKHVPRSENARADALVNEALDAPE